ncbi:S41 family peptidase [Mucilaginibacter sp. MD40]|uniref:S41 family peptidase n=1 Tax=Mucilaginibacter sp. MD40 TaxID=2029590 RepID=UPI0013044DA7|nr:S41 family peptidase [Mucilaginibacter sp. MD40]
MSFKSLFYITAIYTSSFLSLKASAQNYPSPEQSNTSKMQTLYKGLAGVIRQYHYAPPLFNDGLSAKIYSNYLIKLDPNKAVFLQSDIDHLNKYQYTLDDELRGEKMPLQFYDEIQRIYFDRLKELSVLPIFSRKNWRPGNEDEIIFPADSLKWCFSRSQRTDRWNRLLSYEYFVKEADLEKGYSDKSLLKEKIVKALRNKYEHWLKSKLQPVDSFASFADYVNVITFILDPHSEYQPPVNKTKYDQQMSNLFYGVGITLGKTDQGDIKVLSVMTGAAASKSKKINPGDLVISFAEGEQGVWEDVDGLEIPELIDKIRGKGGSIVKLKVKDSKTGLINDVSLVREKVNVQESGARSGIIKTAAGKKIGMLYLPEFYNDYAHWDGAKSANDVARELKLLQNEKIDALIVDLRYNGGGSLDDVVKICGYFVKYGPIVQVKDQKGELRILTDDDGTTLYDGPMAVLVNGYSASASEIFAAAMQDYRRAVIVGTDTYGKGTVQHQLPLGTINQDGEPSFGALKLTMEKFYRINGSTTQKNGVHPDLCLPDLTSYAHFKEKDQFSVLPADTIDAVSYHLNTYTPVKIADTEFLKYPDFSGRFTRMDSISRFLSSKRPQVIGLKQAETESKIKQEQMNRYLELEKVEAGQLETKGLGQYAGTDWYQVWLKKSIENIWVQRTIQYLLTQQ